MYPNCKCEVIKRAFKKQIWKATALQNRFYEVKIESEVDLKN